MNKEEQEFNEFMAKLDQKLAEIQIDFNKLSMNNKSKVVNTVNQVARAKGIIEFLKWNWKL